MRPIASLMPAKISYEGQHACSYSLKTEKSTFGKVLKYQNPLFLAKARKISLPTDKSLELKSSHSQIYQKSQMPANNSFLAHESAVLEVRKDIESKFKRTRLILKEEGKMQRYEKIQKIYEGKHKKIKPYKYTN